MEYRILNIKGALLDIHQLEDYLRKIASGHLLKDKSDKNTYPIPRLNENFKFITEVYKLLNEHIKLKLPIHPAGEWILDNFYIIDETVKMVTKELTLKKYVNFFWMEIDQVNWSERKRWQEKEIIMRYWVLIKMQQMKN